MDDVRQFFSSKVSDYTASRPSYPAALFEDLAALGLAHDMSVADIGAGTGLFTKSLLDRGWNVIAVEPNNAMRAAADTALSQYPRYRSVAGAAEATALEDRSIDLITAAQAFHWFDIEPARRECLRILRPHGQVALIWNDRDLTDLIQRELDDLFTEFGGAKRKAVLAREDRSSVATFFGAGSIRKQIYPHEQQLDCGGLVSLALSRSYMPGRDTPEGQRVIELVSQLHQRQAEDGLVTVRYQTVMSVGRPA